MSLGRSVPGDAREERARVLPKDMMTAKEASAYLSMDEATVTRMAAERRIPRGPKSMVSAKNGLRVPGRSSTATIRPTASSNRSKSSHVAAMRGL